MTVGELISVMVAIVFSVNIYKGYKKEKGSTVDYILGRGFIPWMIFAYKFSFIVGTVIYFCNKIDVPWYILNYKLF